MRTIQAEDRKCKFCALEMYKSDRRKNICLFDNDENTNLTLRLFLAELGHRVMVCDSPDEYLAETKNGYLAIDVIFIDYERFSTAYVKVIHEMQRHNPGSKTIMLTPLDGKISIGKIKDILFPFAEKARLQWTKKPIFPSEIAALLQEN
jgi:DNA-binding NtrC family response regulator